MVVFSSQDSLLVIEQHKSGFEPPADVEFEDYAQGIKTATSDSSLNQPKVRNLRWPFNKKHKVNSHTRWGKNIPSFSSSAHENLKIFSDMGYNVITELN